MRSSASIARELRQTLRRRLQRSEDFDAGAATSIHNVSEDILINIFKSMTVEDMKRSRLVCSYWNDTILDSPQLYRSRTCFYFDGRRDENGIRCNTYFNTEGESAASLWNMIRIRSSSTRHLSWIQLSKTATISHLEFHNCSLHWSALLRTLTEFSNLTTLKDVQDMYLWDYAMFNEGISEDQQVTDTSEYPQFLESGRLPLLANLRHVHVHRSNIRDCATYLKILALRCENIETLEITTDCNFPLGRSTRLYAALANLLEKNTQSLTKLRFPYRNIYFAYDYRFTEDQRPFRDFMNYIHRENWAGRIHLRALTHVHLSFPMIYLDQDEIEEKLGSFLNNQPALNYVRMSTVSMEAGKEDILRTLLPPEVGRDFDIYINDGRSFPDLPRIMDVVTSVTVQTWRITATEVGSVLLLQDEAGDPVLFDHTKEFQYFSKSHTFKDFNVHLVASSFSNITKLNLVDHNTRVEHRHSSEALAVIEDEQFQTIIKTFKFLVEMQVVANLAYLTDAGLTGIRPEACKRMLKTETYVKAEEDLNGLPLSSLRHLEVAILRGVGIKITDVTLHFAFGTMERLKTLHIFGSHQTTPTGRLQFHQKFPIAKGYDIEL